MEKRYQITRTLLYGEADPTNNCTLEDWTNRSTTRFGGIPSCAVRVRVAVVLLFVDWFELLGRRSDLTYVGGQFRSFVGPFLAAAAERSGSIIIAILLVLSFWPVVKEKIPLPQNTNKMELPHGGSRT